jgi:hypothetical protein
LGSIYIGDPLSDPVSEFTVSRLRNIGDNSWHQSAVWALRSIAFHPHQLLLMEDFSKHPGRWRARTANSRFTRSLEGRT